MPRFIVLAAAFALVLAACESSTAPQPFAAGDLPLLAASVSDGAHGGTDGFYFLPPMVKNPSHAGAFDPGLEPVVEICATPGCEAMHRVYSTTEGEGPEVVRVSDAHYIVNWNTHETGAEAGQAYRVRVRVGEVVLGWANVVVVSTGREAVTVRRDGSIALVAGQTLPIRFRIETGIAGSVDVSPATAEVEPGASVQFAAQVRDLHGEPLGGVPVVWSTGDAEVATVSDQGLATGEAAGTTLVTATAGAASGSAVLAVREGDDEGGEDAFVTVWDTRLAPGTTVSLPLWGAVDATIDWGDGTVTRVTTPGPHVHDYGEDGIYTVAVRGTVQVYGGMILADAPKLIRVEAWGDLGLTSMWVAFYGATNLTEVPGHTRGLEQVTDMSGKFFDARSFNGDIGAWDTSNVQNMAGMFFGARSFNGDIGAWDVSNVTNMHAMFGEASAFNQDIGAWKTGNVEDMSTMFAYASAFNQDIGRWDTSRVVDMMGMFREAVRFDQDLGKWKTGQVLDMSLMFREATSFNQDIGGWDTGNVTSMSSMFEDATSFNQDIGGWDTSSVTDMAAMFRNAASFNQDLSSWCVPLISLPPNSFDSGATAWTLPRPVWGTCPGEG